MVKLIHAYYPAFQITEHHEEYVRVFQSADWDEFLTPMFDQV